MSSDTEAAYPQAVLRFPSQNGALLTFGKAVFKVLSDPAYTNVDPPLPEFAADLKAFDDTQTTAVGKGKGTAKQRNAKKQKVKKDLKRVCAYIQGLADKAPSPADAAAVITGALLYVRKTPSRNKPELSAANTGLSGDVLLDAKAVAPDATYFFQYSMNQKDWVSVPEVMKCKTIVSGLTSATVYYFRFRAISRKGRHDWSQVVSLIVT
jgi:hypothetical protein